MSERNDDTDRVLSAFNLAQEPDFINDDGVKFWINKDATKHAHTKGLNNVIVYIVKHPDGIWTHLICENNEPIYDTQLTEAMYAHLDFKALAERGD